MNTESSYTHPTYLCQQWLQSRKGKGDKSMWEKGAKGGNYLPPLRQGKTCMVKAKMLKAWSQGFIYNGGERVAVKPSRFVASYSDSGLSNSVKPACSPSGRLKDRTGHLTMSILRAIELQDCLHGPTQLKLRYHLTSHISLLKKGLANSFVGVQRAAVISYFSQNRQYLPVFASSQAISR